MGTLSIFNVYLFCTYVQNTYVFFCSVVCRLSFVGRLSHSCTLLRTARWINMPFINSQPKLAIAYLRKRAVRWVQNKSKVCSRLTVTYNSPVTCCTSCLEFAVDFRFVLYLSYSSFFNKPEQWNARQIETSAASDKPVRCRPWVHSGGGHFWTELVSQPKHGPFGMPT